MQIIILLQVQMELPQIIQDDKAMKSELIDLIQQRYELSNKQAKFNFESGQLTIIENIQSEDSILKAIQQILTLFLKNNIQNIYCYFSLKSILQNPSSDLKQKVQAIKDEQNAINKKQSHFHKINHLILMRQILLDKLEGRTELTKETYDFIDDIRFITEEVIKAIQNWKNLLKARSLTGQNIIYVYKNHNYITKIIGDNVSILKALNAKQPIFHSHPNPFFIFYQGKIPGMSTVSINSLLQFLSEEKAQELKMMIQSPYIQSQKTVHLEHELRQLRSTVDEKKTDQIKTIYQTSKSPSSRNFHNLDKVHHQHLIEKTLEKNKESLKNLDSLIKSKELEVLRAMKKNKGEFMRQSTFNEKDSLRKSSIKLGYKSKLQNLKAQIEKNVKVNEKKQKKKLPNTEAQIKVAKPKIKIVCQRQTPVDNTIKGMQNEVLGQKTLMRSRSTFYKQTNIEGNDQKKQQGQGPSSRVFLTNSAYSFKSLPQQARKRSNTVNFILRPSILKKVHQDKQKDDSKHTSREEELNDIKESLTVLNHKIREQSIKNIYSNKSKYNKTSSGFQTNQSRSRSIEKREISHENVKKVQTYNEEGKHNNIDQMLKEKEKHIADLKQRLKSLRSENAQPLQESQLERVDSESAIVNDRFRQERQQLELQNFKIKEEMKLEEIKYLTLKEQEYKLKEQQMQNKYKQQLEKIKQNLLVTQTEFQKKVIEEKKKNKEVEDKLKDLVKHSEIIKNQLQEKEIKQKLFSQILKQETLRKQKQAEKKQQKDRNQAIMAQFQAQQEQYKKELEKKAIEIFEEEKLKLQALHIDMQKKNALLQSQNKKRQQLIQKLELQKQTQEEQLLKLKQELQKKDKQQKLQNYLIKQESVPPSEPVLPDHSELQQLRERLKYELIQEIRRKRQEEEEQQRQYEQNKKRHLLELEEELRKAMKMEDQQISKIQEEYKRRNEQMIRQHEEEMLKQQLEKQRMQEQSKKKLEQAKHSEPFQLQKLVNIETGLQQKQAVLDQRPSKENEKLQVEKRPQDTVKVSLTQSKTVQNEPEPKQQVKSQKENDKQAQEIKQQQNIAQVKESSNKIQSKESRQAPIEQVPTESPTKLPTQPSKVTHAVKQDISQNRQKYENLLSMVTKPIKQIYLALEDLEAYLNRYYTLLPPEVKEMLPYSRKELENIFKTKKIDIFDNYSFGWYRPTQKKYLLLGSFESIPIIGAKYGEIQVQQVFIFTKANAYQKSFLSKLIKVYEKIGYIYQKKTTEEGKFSIKFIVKVPKQIAKNEVEVTDSLEIKTTVLFDDHSETDQTFTKTNCIYYLLTQGLKQLLSEKQKVQIASKDDHESKFINKKINDEGLNNAMVKTQKITDKIAQVSLSIPLQYYQTENQSFYLLKATQYELPNTQDKIYIQLLKETRIAVVIHQMNETDVPREFHLDSFIQTKIKKIEQSKQRQIFLPMWQNNLSFKGKPTNYLNSFTYRQITKPSLIYGSVVNSRVHKGDFIFIEPPFVFLVFEVNASDMLRRILFGHIVQENEVLKTKRTMSPM